MGTVISIITTILEVILCYFIASIIHELGHIAVGLTNGWRLYLLIVGPLGIRADKRGKLHFYFEKRVAMWGGVGGTIPKNADADNIKTWSKVLLGGPLASIVLGAICLPIGVYTRNIVFLLIGAMSLGMGVASAIPLKTGVTYTDGGRWRRLHKRGQEADEEIALFKITENQIMGGDFLRVDLNSVESLIKSKEIGIQYYGYYYKFKYYKAKCNAEESKLALKKMDELKSRVPSIILNDCKVK